RSPAYYSHRHHHPPYLHHVLSPFFFHRTPPPEIYTLSLHDALPISAALASKCGCDTDQPGAGRANRVASQSRDSRRRAKGGDGRDRKSTRLNSSHVAISYAVFCLKKKNCSN